MLEQARAFWGGGGATGVSIMETIQILYGLPRLGLRNGALVDAMQTIVARRVRFRGRNM